MPKPLPARRYFRRDIVCVLLLKVIALFILWELFFSDPLEHHLTKDLLVGRFLEL